MKQPYYNFDADESAAIYLKEDPILDDVPHFHDSVEFIFVTKGRIECFLESKSEILDYGDIFFAESYETHYYRPMSEEISAIVLVLSRDYIQTFRNLYPGLTFDTFLKDKEKNKKIFEIMSEWVTAKNRTQILDYSMANLLFSLLIDRYPTKDRHPYEGDILQKELLRYIHLHYLEDMTVISMAHDLGYSPEYCSKILKKCLRGGVRNYINALRIRKANEMLEDKSLKLTQSEVLYQCGFSSPSTYYRVKKQLEDDRGMNMEDKILKVAIIGMGGRGGYAYGPYLVKHKEKFKIVAICDIDEYRLKKWGDYMSVPEENRFNNEEDFFKEKRADVLFVTTMDKLHIRHANKGLDLGYNLLVEKPITDSKEELDSLVKHAHETNRIVMVCHVLRYTVWIKKCKEIIDSGAIGELVSIDHTENVVYWHEAHSFVRGNWHNREETAPMILAKCCHDLDLLQYFAHSKCKYISSMGDLRYFKKKNHPEGASDRCVNCKYVDSCTYSAKRIYIDDWLNGGKPQDFPFTLITDVYPVTEKALWDSITNGRYGKCVFCCNNDVVDNQTVIMTFENGITASLKMEAFVRDGGRDIIFYGTDGELILNEGKNTITLKRFRGPEEVWKINELTNDLHGHGGGDHLMLDALYEVMALGNKNIETSIDASAESHYMALAAEESRLKHGELIDLAKYR